MRRYGIHFGYWGNMYQTLGPEECLRQCKMIGANAYEFFPTRGMFEGNVEQIRTLRDLLDELDVEPLFTYGFPEEWDMTSEDASMREKAVNYLADGIKALGALGARTLGGITYSHWPANYNRGIIEPDVKERGLERVIKCLRRVMPIARDNGVTLCLEIVNRFEHYLMNTAAEGMAVCDAVGTDCKLLLDVFHMNIEEDDIPAAIRSAKGYIGHFHVSEPNRRVPYHTARIDWAAVGQALRDIEYDRCVVLEPFIIFGGEQGHNMRMWRNLEADCSLENRLEIAKKGIAYIRQQFEGEM